MKSNFTGPEFPVYKRMLAVRFLCGICYLFCMVNINFEHMLMGPRKESQVYEAEAFIFIPLPI